MPERLPYESATSGERAIRDIQRVLIGFGAQSFGSMVDFEHGRLIVEFRYRDMPVRIEASVLGYAQAWLRRHPWSRRMRKTRGRHEAEAQRVAQNAVYSIVRDWLKGQVTAVETGVLSFEHAFLGQVVLPNGVTVYQHVAHQRLLTAGDGA